MCLFLDSSDCDAELCELTVFEENYALLSNTIIDIVDPLIKCFAKEKLITIEEEKEIADITSATEKKLRLLHKNSTLLKANNTRGFYMMLNIMKEHGCKGTQTLADHIMSKLKPSPDDPLQTCDDTSSSIHLKGLLNFITMPYTIRFNIIIHMYVRTYNTVYIANDFSNFYSVIAKYR